MPSFTFAAVDEAGKVVSGVRAAATRQEVISRLRAENLVVTSVAEESAAGASDSKHPGRAAMIYEAVFSTKVKQADLMIFSRQFAAMLKAGISLTDSLHTIAHSVNNPALRAILLTVRTDVQRGQSLTEAMRKHPNAFDPLFLSIVHAGETSGSLAQNIARLSLYLQRREGFRLKLRAATAYPKFVLVFFGILTGGIFLFLIPKFNDLFTQFGAKLPALTATVMNMSLFVKHYILVILPVLIALVVTLLVLRRTPKGGAIVDRWILKVPFFGRLFLHAAVARLSMTLSTLLSNGLPLTDALEIATGTLGNAVLEEGCVHARKEVMNGSSLAESLSRIQEMPRLLPRMVRVGEEAGTLSGMLEDVANYYDQEVDYALGRIAAVIEPILICGMGAVVLVVVVAVYLPIFNIGRMMGGHQAFSNRQFVRRSSVVAVTSAPNKTSGMPDEALAPKQGAGKAAAAAAGDGAGDPDMVTNGRVPGRRIGEILVDLGYATPVQIDQALESKEDAYARLGVRLLRKGVINEGQLAYAVSLRLGVGFTELADPSEIQPAAIAAVPDRIARRYSLIPLRIEGNVLVVAMGSPGNVYALDVVRAVTGYEVKPVAAPEHAIHMALERCYGISSELQSSATELATTGTEELMTLGDEGTAADTEQLRNEAEDAPVVKYVDSLISDSIAGRASDIHIEPGRDAVSVRVRVDGRLRRTIPPPKQMQNAVISRIKILSRLDIAEKRLPLDGRMRAKFQGREVDLRVSTLPSINGEKVVMRILDRSSVNLELGKIITDAAFLAHLEKILGRQNGMILVTGPTGSGKTTTLYASLQYVKNVSKNVISVEDPIEYEVEGVTQVHARPEIGLTFARALRSILRQDPDIIMVGEMRDLETLEIGIRSALTGHLVLSTIHTNDSVSTITRMVNMGTEPYLIASTLITAVAQRLVRTICSHCKEEYDLPDPVRHRLHEILDQDIPRRLWRGTGCANCAGTGYRGRAAVFEYFHLDDEAKELVTRRAPEVELRAHQRKHSSGSLLDNALRKAIAGVTSVDDALELEMSI